MEAVVVSSLARIMSAARLAKAGGAVSGSVQAGLKSVGLVLPSSAVLRSAALASATLGSAALANAALGSAASTSAALGSAASTSAVLGGTMGSLLKTLHVPYLLEAFAEAPTAFPLGGKMAAAVIGGAMALGAVPVVLGAMGFTGAGIAASSLAAKMMSVSAIANGGGVAAGSLVAVLQSIGAAGLSLSSTIILGFTGSALGFLMG